jgi:CheY-like chemotaxis protein
VRVVVADDLVQMRFLMRTIAEDAGAEVVGEASDGAKAVEEVQLHEPDVVLMDYAMPVMDGLEATRLIKSRYPAIQVIAYTSTDDPAVERAFLDAGACDHIEKGEFGLLAAAIERCAKRAAG